MQWKAALPGRGTHPLRGRALVLRGRAVPLVSMLLGVILVVVAVAQLHRDRPTPTSFHAAPPAIPAPAPDVGKASAPPTSASPPASSSAAPHASAAASPAASPAPSSQSVASPLGALSAPARLALPSLGVQAPVESVVTTNGVLGVPENPAHVGWWAGSVLPGSPAGSAVLDGHVDSAAAGAGALFHLGDLRPGDPVTVTNTGGGEVRYRVYDRHVYVKHQGLPAQLFTGAGPGRLVLITCGGAFNTATRSYQDNIVVLAAPLQ